MKKLKKRDYDDNIRGTIFNPIEINKYKEIYSNILTEEFYKSYSIPENERESFEKSVIFSAISYKEIKTLNLNTLQVFKADQKIVKLKQSLTKSLKEYQKFCVQPEENIKDYFDILDRIDEEDDEKKYDFIFTMLSKYSCKYYNDDGVYYPLQGIEDFILLLLEGLEQLEADRKKFNFKKMDALKIWFQDMKRIVETVLKTDFTEGMYYPELNRHDSLCVRFLYQLIKPIEPSMTEKKLANSIKRLRKKII